MQSQTDLMGIGGSKQILSKLFALTSTTIVVPFTGHMLVRAAGAGASGARAPSGGNATGGGAGEMLVDVVPVVAGDTVTITIGAGGAQQTTLGTAGTAGGDTTVACTGYSAMAKGGGAGQQAASGAVSGGTGGTAGTGGTSKVVRRDGGRGGAITGAGNTNKTTGGGAYNILGLTQTAGTRGGDVSQNDATARGTGGAGIGGRGGDITTSAVAYTTAGGAGGAAADNSTATAGTNYFQEVSTSAPTDMQQSAVALLPFGYFCGASTGANSGNGAGGPSSATLGYAGGKLAGGGAGTAGAGGAGGLAAGGGAGSASGGAGGGGFADITFVRSI